MTLTGDQVPFILALGTAALSLASLLWALRISDGARGAAKKFRERAGQLEEQLARADSVFGAHPGVILVWEGDALEHDGDDITAPRLYGSPSALAGLLKYTDEAISVDPAVRIIEGLADLEARDSVKQDTTLRQRLKELRQDGTAFSLKIIGPGEAHLDADGRTAGARAVVWITDATTRGIEESAARGRLEEARQVIASDPTAFLEMLRKSPFPAWRVSGMGKLQWANQAYLDAVEAPSLDTALERQLMLDEKASEQMKQTINQGRDIDETRSIAINKERRAMRVLSFPLSGGAGAMAFDVTEQEAAHEELDLHVQAHSETLNHVADGVVIFGQDRRLHFNNRAFAEILGLDERFLLEKPSHGELLDRLRMRQILAPQTNFAEWRAEELAHYLDISGVAEDTWSLNRGRTLSIKRQRHPLGGLLILVKDITQELHLQTRYNALINTQAATLDNLHEACAVFGGDGRLKLSNKAFRTLWKLDEEDLRDGPDYDEIVDKCIPLFHDRAVWTAIKGHVTDISPEARTETKGEMRLVENDEKINTLTYLTHPLPDGNTLIAFADVTATRSVERALRERAEAHAAADRLKTEFVQNVSYQLRSPLTTILGYAEFLESQRNDTLSERQLDFVRSILAASDHLSKLIENILDLAMIEAGGIDLDLSEFDLEAVIGDSVDMVVTKAEDTQITVRAELSGDLGLIKADERRIRQVLFNLFSNAMRFTDEGGEIVVSAQRIEDQACIIVRDNGRGIEADKQVSTFDSFSSSDHRGAGLGLALVKHFVELHGGKVKLQSALGEGTEVQCWLPVQATGDVTTTDILLDQAMVA